MRKVLLLAACASVMASCTNTAKQAAKEKEQATIDSLKTEIVKREIIDSMNRIMTMTQTMPANNETKIMVVPAVAAAAPAVAAVSHASSKSYKAKKRTAARRAYRPAYRSPQSNYAPAYAAAPAYETSNEYTAVQRRKKGWNSKLKGSVIGAGAGAVAGALIDRKKGRGAILGGLLGAGSGLGIGAILDNRNR